MSADAPTQASSNLAAVPAPVCQPDADLVQAVTLSDVSWNVYVELRDNPANRGLRMTYINGELEIMTISGFHELISLMIDHFIMEWCIAMDIDVRPSGSMTLRRKALNQGLEADQSYYIQSEPAVRGLELRDVDQAPMPDLAIGVEPTSGAGRKLAGYASLGVPEVWRWRAETLTVVRLQSGEYQEHSHSEALKGFALDRLRSALSQRQQQSATALLRQFRQGLQ
ncbi:MAG: Uma2 family endonuclease [Planctomycetales bacterium]|nr:Uma2 family endonuclease [Planctomycetales bacterium]